MSIPEYFNTFFTSKDLKLLPIYDDTILNVEEKNLFKNNFFIYYHLIDDKKETALEYAKLLGGYDGSQGFNPIDSIIKFPGWTCKERLLNMINGLKFLKHCETNKWLFKEAIITLRNRFLKTIKGHYDYPFFWLHNFRTVFTYEEIHKFYPGFIAVVYPNLKDQEYLKTLNMEIPNQDFLDYVDYYHHWSKIIKVWKLDQGYLILNCEDLGNCLN